MTWVKNLMGFSGVDPGGTSITLICKKIFEIDREDIFFQF
jgi:hypothetical protein